MDIITNLPIRVIVLYMTVTVNEIYILEQTYLIGLFCMFNGL